MSTSNGDLPNRSNVKLAKRSKRLGHARHLLDATLMYLRHHRGVAGSFQDIRKRIRSQGVLAFGRKILFVASGRRSAALERAKYAEWRRWRARQDDRDMERYREPPWADSSTRWPRISIVLPTFNTPIPLLTAAIDSVVAQKYPHWELCIADDASTNNDVRAAISAYAKRDSRIRFTFRTTNGHISAATNTAISMATTDWIAFLDHDDELHPMAILRVAESIAANSSLELIYSDEDKIDESGRRSRPLFKPSFDPLLLLGQNYICHLTVMNRNRIRAIGGLREGFEGAQDWDLLLRYTEKLNPKKIKRIPEVLYHWRVHSASTAHSNNSKPYAIAAAKRAVDEHLKGRNINASSTEHPEAPGMLRIEFACPNPPPSIEIIIPTRDRADLLSACVHSIIERTTYPNYTICIVDNGSTSIEARNLLADLQLAIGIRILRDDSPFNYPALNNAAVITSSSDYICLLNNDIEVINPEWLTSMIAMGSQPDAGCIGARLWYSNDTVQHAGVVLGIGGIAGHAFRHFPRGDPGYSGWLTMHRRSAAVTGACMLVRRETYESVSGLDPRFKVAFNDVDFCLRISALGLHNAWTPAADLYHHESATRGPETGTEKAVRFTDERKLMLERWGTLIAHDPYYNPNLSRRSEGFVVADTDELKGTDEPATR